ncbi:MAG TPA: hypothetical protein VF763_06605 [Candidatus Limnocylindrales bacterium]
MDANGPTTDIGSGASRAAAQAGPTPSERRRAAAERPLGKLARFLLSWLAAFLLIVTLFAEFGQQLTAMSPQVRALAMSGVLVVAMNFLVAPAITRLLSRLSGPGAPRARDRAR